VPVLDQLFIYLLVRFDSGIMGKRVVSTGITTAAKKVKVNPVFAEVQDALKKAEHLPENCRAMLAAMVPTSFATQREERSEHQVTVIQWVQSALEQQEGKFVAEADAVSSKLAELEAAKGEKVKVVEAAEASLADKKRFVALKKNALAEATITMTATKKMLAEKQEEQQVCDSDYLAMKKEQEGLAAAFVEHFKAPMQAGESLHYESLQPYLRNLDLEESFMVSVPASCAKTKDERGSFDNVVLQALEQALLDRAAQIKDVVSNRSPESEAREVGVRKAEEQLVVDRAAQEKASAELAAAQKDVELGSATLKEVEKVVESCEVDIKATSELCNKLRSIQEEFQQGPLASFRRSKDGIAADICATAGA